MGTNDAKLPALDGSVPADAVEVTPLLQVMTPVARRWRSVAGLTLLAGVLAFGATYLYKPRFIATATFIPPTQQNSAAAALSSLGSLAGLGGPQKSTSDQLVGLLQSTTIADRLVDQFKLQDVYDEKYRFLARDKLAKRSVISVGKKDGLVTIAVEDTEPTRAAAIANQYIAELRQLTSTLAVSEAQRRRMFFEKQLQATRASLVAAQVALQDSGITQGALKATPGTAASNYARVQAELTMTEVQLQTMRESRADTAPELRQLEARAQALRGQMAGMERPDDGTSSSADYVGKYREFKYQETLLEMLSKQYELARVDEAREGELIQIVDVARTPEYKSSPKRAPIAIAAAAAALLLSCVWLVLRARWEASLRDPLVERDWATFKSALRQG